MKNSRANIDFFKCGNLKGVIYIGTEGGYFIG